jgi:hypothetical protein
MPFLFTITEDAEQYFLGRGQIRWTWSDPVNGFLRAPTRWPLNSRPFNGPDPVHDPVHSVLGVGNSKDMHCDSCPAQPRTCCRSLFVSPAH